MSVRTAGGDREMVITRVLAAPRELVFDAWTDSEHIGRWWGPNGFTTTNFEMDVRPGGTWRYVMHGPDGTDYPNRMRYLEVVRPERIVYDHDDDVEDDPRRFRTTVTFTEEGGGTRITMRSLFSSVEQYEQVKAFGAVEGGHQTLARLEEYLAGR